MSLKIWIFGRQSATKELLQWRRDALRENGAYSFLSKKQGELQVHHGFHVAAYPYFALARWNDWVMTKKEHDAYHSWERATFKHPITRRFIAETPISLYWWAYFKYHWWKGWGLLCLFLFLYSLGK